MRVPPDVEVAEGWEDKIDATDPAKGTTAQIDSKRINAIEGPGVILNCFILVVERATSGG